MFYAILQIHLKNTLFESKTERHITHMLEGSDVAWEGTGGGMSSPSYFNNRF